MGIYSKIVPKTFNTNKSSISTNFTTINTVKQYLIIFYQIRQVQCVIQSMNFDLKKNRITIEETGKIFIYLVEQWQKTILISNQSYNW